MSEKPKILVIGGTEQGRKRLLNEIYEKLDVMTRAGDEDYFHVFSTDHPWNELILRSIRG